MGRLIFLNERGDYFGNGAANSYTCQIHQFEMTGKMDEMIFWLSLRVFKWEALFAPVWVHH